MKRVSIGLLLATALRSQMAEFEKGMTFASKGDFEAAAAPLARACAAQIANACYFQGRNLYILARHEEAIEPLTKALLEASPENRARAHRAIAMNYQALGQAADAERHYVDGLKAGGDANLPVDFGAFLFRQGRIEEARKHLESAVRAGSPPRSRGELGRVLLQSGEFAEAATHLETEVAASPKAWNYRLLLGRAYVQLGRLKEGERELEAARQGLAGSSTSK